MEVVRANDSAQVSGAAVTVLLHPGDNRMIHVVAEQIPPGHIVVAAITAECTGAGTNDAVVGSGFYRTAAWRRDGSIASPRRESG
jgi:4-hydroxy-4-methyl-2-oxoglutarate aldolase